MHHWTELMQHAPTTALLDREVALARAGGDIELLREIATLFLNNYKQWLEELRAAAEKPDARALEQSAHGMKGSVSNFGAQLAVEAAVQLENMGRSRDLAEVAQVLNTLELALAALRPELESI
jgi:HPt (histidine-containing phosphotransfer) domain-containing protein